MVDVPFAAADIARRTVSSDNYGPASLRKCKPQTMPTVCEAWVEVGVAALHIGHSTLRTKVCLPRGEIVSHRLLQGVESERCRFLYGVTEERVSSVP